MRRLISLISASVALVALALVLYNATTVDRKPPAIKSITLSAPGADAHQAQTVTAIDIEFSEPVQTATVESRFHIEPAVDGAFTWDGSTAIFTPSQKLPADSDFTISIAPGFEDLAGNADEARPRRLGLPDDRGTRSSCGSRRRTPRPACRSTATSSSSSIASWTRPRSRPRSASSRPLRSTATWSGSVVTLTFGCGPGLRDRLHAHDRDGRGGYGGSHLAAPFVTHFTTVAAGLGIDCARPRERGRRDRDRARRSRSSSMPPSTRTRRARRSTSCRASMAMSGSCREAAISGAAGGPEPNRTGRRGHAPLRSVGTARRAHHLHRDPRPDGRPPRRSDRRGGRPDMELHDGGADRRRARTRSPSSAPAAESATSG